MTQDEMATRVGARELRIRQERFYEFERWACPGEPSNPSDATVEFRPQVPNGLVLASEDAHPAKLHAERVVRYLFAADKAPAGGGGPLVELVVAECESARAARASVMDVLTSQMANTLRPADHFE